MIFDGIVFGAYFSGSLLILLGTLVRYIFTGELRKIRRIINIIKVVGLRKKTPDSFGMLMQFTGVLSLLFGTFYGIILRRFVIEGMLNDCLAFLVLLSPPFLFIGAVKLLQKYYWQSQ